MMPKIAVAAAVDDVVAVSLVAPVVWHLHVEKSLNQDADQHHCQRIVVNNHSSLWEAQALHVDLHYVPPFYHDFPLRFVSLTLVTVAAAVAAAVESLHWNAGTKAETDALAGEDQDDY